MWLFFQCVEILLPIPVLPVCARSMWAAAVWLEAAGEGEGVSPPTLPPSLLAMASMPSMKGFPACVRVCLCCKVTIAIHCICTSLLLDVAVHCAWSSRAYLSRATTGACSGYTDSFPRSRYLLRLHTHTHTHSE